jgi:hypothetical protein
MTRTPRARNPRPRTRVRDGARLLGIYLNDHLAGSAAGVELARRLARDHRGSPIGDVLEPLAEEISEDRVALLGIMAALGVSVCSIRTVTAWAAEKVSRLGLNGRLLGRSPLSSLLELETLRLGVEGKAAGWRTLGVVASRDRRLDPRHLEVLVGRARRQAALLEELHAEVAETLVAAAA